MLLRRHLTRRGYRNRHRKAFSRATVVELLLNVQRHFYIFPFQTPEYLDSLLAVGTKLFNFIFHQGFPQLLREIQVGCICSLIATVIHDFSAGRALPSLEVLIPCLHLPGGNFPRRWISTKFPLIIYIGFNEP